MRRAGAVVWRVAREVSARFGRDGCSLMAAATAFYGFLSLIPLGVLAMSVSGRVLGSSAAAWGQLQTVLRAVFPSEPAVIEDAIRQFTHPRGRWFVEIVSLLGLVWAGSRLFHTLEDVLTRVWSGHGMGRPLLVRHLIALGATAAAGLLFLGSMLATAAAAALASGGGRLGAIPRAVWSTPWLLAFAAWVMFMLMYQFLPQERVRWRDAAIGAGAAAVMWEVCRAAFAALMAQGAAYGRLYGSLAGTVVVAVWIYVTALILLVGAEIAVVLQREGGGDTCCGSGC